MDGATMKVFIALVSRCAALVSKCVAYFFTMFISIWTWNLVSHSEGANWADGICKYVAEEDMWV